MGELYYIDKGLKELVIMWFQDIEEQCTELTSGNISHKRPTINGIASRSKQYIEEFEKDCEPTLHSKLIKYFSTIEDMADELTTGNVAHKKAAIKGFACRAKEYLIKHT